jgi:hypothetical protein
VSRSVRLDVFAETMVAEFDATGWTLYRVGNEGKRSDTGLVIPSFITVEELDQYLFDLLHEAAKPSHPTIRRLPER